MKESLLKIALLSMICFGSAGSCGDTFNRPASKLETESQTSKNDLVRTAALFREREYSEALPILERLVNTDPTDDQAVSGLGVALIYVANSEKDFEKRRPLVIRAR
jgi:hypothetical protein